MNHLVPVNTKHGLIVTYQHSHQNHEALLVLINAAVKASRMITDIQHYDTIAGEPLDQVAFWSAKWKTQ